MPIAIAKVSKRHTNPHRSRLRNDASYPYDIKLFVKSIWLWRTNFHQICTKTDHVSPPYWMSMSNSSFPHEKSHLLTIFQRVRHLWERDTTSLTFCVRDVAVVRSTLRRRPVLLAVTLLPRWDPTTGLWRPREEELPVPAECLTWSTCREDSTTVSRPPSRLTPLKLPFVILV